MSIKFFLKDKGSFFIFHIILMFFLLGIIGFISVENTYSNLLYAGLVSLTMTTSYLGIEYIRKRSYYKALEERFIEDSLEWINNLPKPFNVEQEYNQTLLLKAYEQSVGLKSSQIEQHKENIDFINTWVHEIKVPVAASKLVIDGNIDNSSEEVLRSLKEEVEKIEDYVEQILYYSKIKDFSRDYFIAQTNMEQLIKDTVKRHKKQFIAKRIGVAFENISYMIDTDKKSVSYILDQIVSNALKYTNDKGQIKLLMEETEDEYKLTVEDNGIGIPKEDIKRVFERGFTGTAGRSNRSSTGIGLYMAQSLAVKLGLFISVQSVFGEGTKFTIHFSKWNDYYIQ